MEMLAALPAQAATTLLSEPVAPWPHVPGPILFFRLQDIQGSSTAAM
jgi:hypothetical protein